jgi:hypothetical protein
MRSTSTRRRAGRPPQERPAQAAHKLPGSLVTHENFRRPTHTNGSPIFPARFTAPRRTDWVLTDTGFVTSGRLPDACYQRLVAAVERAINEADPIRLLGLGAPADEYSPEIGTIVPRLAGVQDTSDVTNVLHEEFVRWFDQRIAGPRDAYEASARRIWAALLEYRDVVE